MTSPSTTVTSPESGPHAFSLTDPHAGPEAVSSPGPHPGSEVGLHPGCEAAPPADPESSPSAKAVSGSGSPYIRQTYGLVFLSV